MDDKKGYSQEDIEALTEIQNEKLAVLLSNIDVPIPLLNQKKQALAQLKSELSLDMEALFRRADEILEEHPEMEEKDLTIELLKAFAESHETSRFGKIAKKMIAEKWWEKHE